MRTIFTVPSTIRRRAVTSFSIRSRAFTRIAAERLLSPTRIAERDWPTSSCSSRESTRRSSSWVSTNRAERLFSCPRASVTSENRESAWSSSVQDSPASEHRKQAAQHQSDRQSDRHAGAKLGEKSVHATIGGVHLALVHALDLIRQTKHCQTAGKHFVTQEPETVFAALLEDSNEIRDRGCASIHSNFCAGRREAFAPPRSSALRSWPGSHPFPCVSG